MGAEIQNPATRFLCLRHPDPRSGPPGKSRPKHFQQPTNVPCVFQKQSQYCAQNKPDLIPVACARGLYSLLQKLTCTRVYPCPFVAFPYPLRCWDCWRIEPGRQIKINLPRPVASAFGSLFLTKICVHLRNLRTTSFPIRLHLHLWFPPAPSSSVDSLRPGPDTFWQTCGLGKCGMATEPSRHIQGNEREGQKRVGHLQLARKLARVKET